MVSISIDNPGLPQVCWYVPAGVPPKGDSQHPPAVMRKDERLVKLGPSRQCQVCREAPWTQNNLVWFLGLKSSQKKHMDLEYAIGISVLASKQTLGY